MKDSKDQIS